MLSGCFRGPNYMVNGFYPDDHQPHIRLSRFSLFDGGFAVERWDQTNYIATVDLESGSDGQPGHVRIGKTSRFGNDSEDEDSTFIQITGTTRWLQLLHHRQWDTAVIIRHENGSPDRTLTSFKCRERVPDAAAYAVSRSGRHLLVADADHVTLWDLVNEHVSIVGDEPLLEARRFLASNRGTVGQWWITDDLRFVVIEPSDSIEVEGGSYRNDKPMYMPIAGTQVDVQQSGVILDRVTHRVTTFPARVDGAQLLDAESVDGELQMLYGSAHRSNRFLIADARGRALFTPRPPSSSDAQFVGWAPNRKQIWFLGGDATFWLGQLLPNSQATISIVNYAPEMERTYKLRFDQIRSSLAHAN